MGFTKTNTMRKPYVTVNVETKVHKRLQAYCKKNSLVMSGIVTDLIEKYLRGRSTSK